MEDLARFKCVPCSGSEPPLTQSQIEEFQKQTPEWQVQDISGVPHLQRIFKVKDFSRALEFTNAVGKLAEQEDHHPKLTTEWGKVTVDWWTHKINGLHQNDFIMAAKSDEAFKELQSS
jgi:4a-hydroxytetrahydrobiopterin dehydratase